MKASHWYSILAVPLFLLGYDKLQEKTKEIVDPEKGLNKIEDAWKAVEKDREDVEQKAAQAVTAQRGIAEVRKYLGWQRLYAGSYTDIRGWYARLLNEKDPRSPPGVPEGDLTETSDFTGIVQALARRETKAQRAYKDMPPKIKQAESTRDAAAVERHANWLKQNPEIDKALEETDRLEATLAKIGIDARREILSKDEEIRALELELKRNKEAWEKSKKRWQDLIHEWEERYVAAVERRKKLEEGKDPGPRGQIVRADAKGGWAVINLGKDHGVRAAFTFRVMRPTKGGRGRFVGDVRVQEPGDFTSFCKLWHANAKDPPLPRDLLFNELWQPGAKFTYFFVGNFELLGPYNNRQTEVIAKAYGNEIRDRLDEDVTYMVLGPPHRKPDPNDPKQVVYDAKEMAGIEDALFRARELGVEVLSAKKFLEWIGYYDFDRIWKEEQRLKTRMDVRQFLGRPATPPSPVPSLESR